ncbi:MAG: cytochrome c3 family protein, partial [Nitrospiria bacterium]
MRMVVLFAFHSLVLMAVLFWPSGVAVSQLPPPSSSQVLEDVIRTKHNLSSVPPDVILSSATKPQPGTTRTVFSPETTEICIFCHTPHGANPDATRQLQAPLWNRNLSEANYQLYDQVLSRSFEGKLNPGAPTGYSRLCLSCHDGTIALGALRNAPGSGGFDPNPGANPPIQMQYAQGVSAPIPFGSIPEGSGTATGNTRRLGVDLKNDHPVSFVYDNALAGVDQELTVPGPPPDKPADEPTYPLGIGPMRRYAGDILGVYNSIQCTSCHNPHQVNYPKFLRANWLQNAPEHPGEQIICLFCHNKPGWIESTHAVATAIRNEYPIVNNDPNNLASGYDFDGEHSVSQYACRSCHDPHTAQGAERLHREGVDTPGGMDAIENTCYLCHSPYTAAILSFFAPAGDPTTPSNPRFLVGSGRPAPDVYTQFLKDSNLGGSGSAMNLRLHLGHEPVFTSYPREGVELYSPFPPPFNKFAAGSGPGETPPPPDFSPDPRHIECVDCHNPHQVVRSNRLKGMRGITYNGLVVGHDSQETGCLPGPCNREPYVYEVCFRCHGNSVTNLFRGDLTEDTAPYYYRSNPLVPATNPNLSMKGFSNKRLEFATYGNYSSEIPATSNPQAGSFVEGTVWGNDATGIRRIGPGANKAFHPVVAPGRNATPALCKQLSRAFGLVGCETSPSAELALSHLSQLTIQCTDCHNNNYYDPYQGGSSLITPQLLGPMTESNLRTTDYKHDGTLPGVTNPAVTGYNTTRSQEPIGPH